MIALGQTPLTGRRVFALLLGFFGIVTAVNMVFLYVALSTHPGADTEDAYRRGVAYNDVLKKAEVQNELGWLGTIEHNAAAKSLRVSFVDSAGQPVTGLEVAAEIRRTVQSGHDFRLPMDEWRPGNYRTELDPPLPGQWQVRIEARNRSGAVYLAQKAIWSK